MRITPVSGVNYFFRRANVIVAEQGAIGLATSLFSGRGPVYSATRQVVIEAVAAAVTYAIGALIGVSLS